jgi:catechol 2,3-dioxygenase-like lactoylglutathione lyase family enzyme
MFDHIGLRTVNLSASREFYTAALAPLGFGLCYEDEATAGLGPADSPALWLHAATPGTSSRMHLALAAPNRSAVDAFYVAAMANGATDNGAAGLRTDYGANYYAAFVLDPDGNNLEAVFQGEAS